MKKLLISLLAIASMGGSHAAQITVGGKNYTEQQLIAEMTTQLLTNRGFTVDKRAGMGTTVLRKALENGQIDMYWEYTGTSLITFNKIKERMSAEKTYETVKKLDGEKGLIWLKPSNTNSTYALAMRKEDMGKGIKTLSDLAKRMNNKERFTFACNAEFYARSDGLKPLQKEYGFKFPRNDIKRMDSGLTYQALKDKQVDIALVFAQDGRIPAFNFYLLKDDKGYFPTYAMAPVVRKEYLDAHPKVAIPLNELSAVLTAENMAMLNASIDVDKVSIEKASKQFLISHDLIK
ncbi:MAG: glycine betaine ABC transporter substrate-binding protein [Ostreibacterium sp.]